MPRKLNDDSERMALAIWNVIAIRIGAKRVWKNILCHDLEIGGTNCPCRFYIFFLGYGKYICIDQSGKLCPAEHTDDTGYRPDRRSQNSNQHQDQHN